ncbi:hypothetical protein MUK42_15416 [Musa troglodytarum]|uniref:Uncharacterized protein n=1 Tax=Musa troglodytarum TaxID=320322 RepID=A0A9E7IJ36_9LILI|nr:hypothetical protein MUK42_15416 [Musa troglodytarum]
MNLIVSDDDNGGFEATKIIMHLRVKTVVIQEYGIKLFEKRQR